MLLAVSDNFFAQLQALSTMNEETTVDKSRKQLGQIVEIFKQREEYLEEVTIFAEKVRNLKVQTLLDCDSFMVQPDTPMNLLPEELQHASLGFCKNSYIVFEGRYVYPVKDVRGSVMGFCGYDKFSEVKYLDSINYGYKAKNYSCFGMEKLPEYYRSSEPVYFVEGIVCCLYLRQCGMQALAWLGSNVSPYIIEVMRRFGMRAIAVCDADEAGTKCRKSLGYRLPGIRVIQSTVAKDIDDSREVQPDFHKELAKLKNPYYRSPMFV